ncbi:hypothetical protein KAW50_08210 [candidate division WOR-3 bacterium]|nr:hypothetical protein [candidate division WOR-3 bacterium]
MDKIGKFRVVPTTFLKRSKEDLNRVLNAVVDNKDKEVVGRLEVELLGEIFTLKLGKIKQGKGIYSFEIPEVKKATPAKFILWLGNRQFHYQAAISPQRHWIIHLVHHAHTDLGFTNLQPRIYRQHYQYIKEAIRLCRLTDSYPEDSRFRWTCENTWQVKNFLERAADRETKEFISRVREGRIEVTGMHFTPYDVYVGHEELVRSVYLAEKLRKRYGMKIPTAMVSDPDGVNWGLPQVLSKSGIRYLSTAVNEMYHKAPAVQNPFYWVGLDGSHVLVWNASTRWKREIMGYAEGGLLGLNKSYEAAYQRLPEYLESLQKNNYPYDILMLRVLGLTIDNAPPKINVSKIVKAWNKKWAYPKLRVSSLENFFSSIEAKFGKQFPHYRLAWPGSTARESYEHGLVRQVDTELCSAEIFATMAHFLNRNYRYPREDINGAYDNLFMANEHTTGSSELQRQLPYSALVRGTRVIYKTDYYEAYAQTKEVIDNSLSRIGMKIKTTDIPSLAIFNSLSWKRSDRIEVIIPRQMLAGAYAFRVVDAKTRKTVPYEIVGSWKTELITLMEYNDLSYQMDLREWQNYLKDAVYISLLAKDIPGLGYRVYNVVPCNKLPHFVNNSISIKKKSMENKFYRITFDSKTGTVTSIYDKELNQELVDQHSKFKLTQLLYLTDKNQYIDSPSAYIHPGKNSFEMASMLITISGKKCGKIEKEIILYNDIKRIDFIITQLKEPVKRKGAPFLSFPFNVSRPQATLESSTNVISSEIGQLPGTCTAHYGLHKWLDISNPDYGITCAFPQSCGRVYFNNITTGLPVHDWGPDTCLHGSSIEKLSNGTFLAGIIFCYQPKGNTAGMAGGGEHLGFRFAITSHRNKRNKSNHADAVRFAWNYVTPLKALILEPNQEGHLPSGDFSFCRIDRHNVVMLAFKKVENNKGYIIRLYETSGKKTAFKITIIPSFKISESWLTNIVERNIKPLKTQNNTISVLIEGFGITTIRIA